MQRNVIMAASVAGLQKVAGESEYVLVHPGNCANGKAYLEYDKGVVHGGALATVRSDADNWRCTKPV